MHEEILERAKRHDEEAFTRIGGRPALSETFFEIVVAIRHSGLDLEDLESLRDEIVTFINNGIEACKEASK